MTLLAGAATAQPTAIEQASAHLREGRTEAALTALRDAIVANPGDARLHNALGSILNQEGRYREALIHAQAAVEAAPAEPRYRVNRGIVLAEHGRFAEAIADFDAALGTDPKLTYAYLEKGAALLSLDRDAEAQAQWSLARASDPALIWPDWYAATGDFAAGRFAEAAAGFAKVAKAEPGFAGAPLWQRLAMARAGQVPEVVRISGDDWPLQLTRFDQGALSFDALLALAHKDRRAGDDRRQGEAYFVAAQKLLSAGKRDEAEALLVRAVAAKAPRHVWKVAAERDLERLRATG